MEHFTNMKLIWRQCKCHVIWWLSRLWWVPVATCWRYGSLEVSRPGLLAIRWCLWQIRYLYIWVIANSCVVVKHRHLQWHNKPSMQTQKFHNYAFGRSLHWSHQSWLFLSLNTLEFNDLFELKTIQIVNRAGQHVLRPSIQSLFKSIGLELPTPAIE